MGYIEDTISDDEKIVYVVSFTGFIPSLHFCI